MGFNFRRVEVSSTAIVSSVTGTLTAELNNTVLLCRDGLSQPGQGEIQQVTATVLGELSQFSIALNFFTMGCKYNYFTM